MYIPPSEGKESGWIMIEKLIGAVTCGVCFGLGQKFAERFVESKENEPTMEAIEGMFKKVLQNTRAKLNEPKETPVEVSETPRRKPHKRVKRELGFKRLEH